MPRSDQPAGADWSGGPHRSTEKAVPVTVSSETHEHLHHRSPVGPLHGAIVHWRELVSSEGGLGFLELDPQGFDLPGIPSPLSVVQGASDVSGFFRDRVRASARLSLEPLSAPAASRWRSGHCRSAPAWPGPGSCNDVPPIGNRSRRRERREGPPSRITTGPGPPPARGVLASKGGDSGERPSREVQRKRGGPRHRNSRRGPPSPSGSGPHRRAGLGAESLCPLTKVPLRLPRS